MQTVERSIETAVKAGDVNQVIALLHSTPNLISHREAKTANTLLHIAVIARRSAASAIHYASHAGAATVVTELATQVSNINQIIDLLIRKNSNLLLTNNRGQRADQLDSSIVCHWLNSLETAIRKNDLKTVDDVMKVNPDLALLPLNSHGETALERTLAQDKPALTLTILAGFDVNTINKLKQQAEHAIAKRKVTQTSLVDTVIAFFKTPRAADAPAVAAEAQPLLTPEAEEPSLTPRTVC